MWTMACHLSALLMWTAIPFAHILGPLVVWLLRRDQSPSVDVHGRESLNFQISLTVYLVALIAVTAALTFLVIGIFLWPLVIAVFFIGPIVDTIFVVFAAIRASDGEVYRYPATIRFF